MNCGLLLTYFVFLCAFLFVFYPVGKASVESSNRRATGDLRSAISPTAWKAFLSVLEQKGFFEGELEGSKRYREKTAMAEVMCERLKNTF